MVKPHIGQIATDLQQTFNRSPVLDHCCAIALNLVTGGGGETSVGVTTVQTRMRVFGGIDMTVG